MRISAAATLIALSLSLVAASTAHADPASPEGKALAEAAAAEGQKAYDRKDYKTAAEHFTYAFNNSQDPAYLFNAAQAYRLANECLLARDAYKHFLDLVKGQDIPNLARVNDYIAQEDKCARDETIPTPTPPVPVVKPVTQPTPVAVEAHRSSPTTAYGAGVAGVVLVGVAVVFHLEEHSTQDDTDALVTKCKAGCGLADKVRLKNLNDTGARDSDIAIASYAVGGAALVTGVVLYALSRRGGERAETRTVGALPTPGGGGEVFAAWRF